MTETRFIPLSQGQVAIVDAADFEWLSQWKWHAYWSKAVRGFYVVRNVPLGNGKRGSLRMHREIMGLGRGDEREVDHVNVNPLDNRRSNLRIASRSENARNVRTRRDSKCGLKGVKRIVAGGGWVARINVDKKQLYLGCYETAEEAHAAYCEAAQRLHGEFARTA